MIFKKLDMISPPITIFYKGNLTHPSIFSGILTLMGYFIAFYFGIRYSMEFIRHQNPQIYYYNRYIEDAGNFPVNSSQIFSFIQVIDTASNKPAPIEFDSVRIIGLETTIDLYKLDNDLSQYNHWLYGRCNNSSDTEGISYLINFDYFTESACIRKYYNKDDKKYYDTNDKRFIFPNIVHGCSHPERTFYGIVLEKCRNDSLKYLADGQYCNSKEHILQYIQKSSINLQLIDNYADVLNYENPFIKYFYSISNGLFEESYTANHLNFNPATLITNDAIFFTNDKKSFAYIYQQNEKVTAKSDDSGIYVAFYYWMQNNMQYYERKYRNFQDALSDIGGLGSLILNLAYILNFLVSNFVILFDTEELLNEIELSKKFSKNTIQKNVYKNLVQDTVINDNLPNNIGNKNDNNKCSPIRKANSNLTYNDFSNNGSITNNLFLVCDNEKIRRNKISSHKNNKRASKKIVKFKNDSLKNNKTIDIYSIDQRQEISQEKKLRKSISFRYMVDLTSLNKRNSKINKPIKRMKFLEYITFYFSCGKIHQRIKCYDEFRCRIISEENLILNYLNVCKLLKATKNIIKDMEDDKNN
jgi:hypothetical protein